MVGECRFFHVFSGTSKIASFNDHRASPPYSIPLLRATQIQCRDVEEPRIVASMEDRGRGVGGQKRVEPNFQIEWFINEILKILKYGYDSNTWPGEHQ